MIRLQTVLLEGVLDLILDRPHLPVAFAAADHEVRGEVAGLADVEQDDIARQPLTGGLDRSSRDLYPFQVGASLSRRYVLSNYTTRSAVIG